jgi:imidazolonepropionase-like amidohydrolase
MSRALVAALGLAALAAFAAAARAENLVGARRPGRVAFVGGTVHPASGPALAPGTVVIRDGRIESVVPGASAPADAAIVECRGKHVWPGLIAANTTMGLSEILSVRGPEDWRETGNLNPNIRAEVQFGSESDHIAVTRINGVTRALSVPRGAGVAGSSALMSLMGWTWEDMTTKAPVALHIQWPAMSPVRSFFEQRSDEEQAQARDEAIAAIRGAFDDARAYWKARDAAAAGRAPRHDADAKWDAMKRAIAGEIPVAFHADALAQIRAVLAFADEQKLTRLILVGGYDAPLVADELVRRGIPVIVAGVLGLPRRAWEPYDGAFTVPARLAAAGVPFAIADEGTQGALHTARNLGHHAAIAASFGLPRDEALRAVTLYPARILGVDDRLGSLEPGKTADLVVTDGDLLDVTTAVEQVWIDGAEVPRVSRQTRLFEKYDARPRGPKARAR